MALTLLHHRRSPRVRSTLMRGVNRGELLRLRPGVFVETWPWLTAKPWIRHAACAAAVSLQQPEAVLCRETALAICGVPLLRVPDAVHLRAASPSACGTAAGAPLTGSLPSPMLAALTAEAARRQDAYASALRPPAVRRCLPPVPQTHTASQGRDLYWSADTGPGAVRLPVPDVVMEDGSRVEARVEPLPFALLDTLPRLSMEQAVMALDAVLARRCGYHVQVQSHDLSAVGQWLWSGKAEERWRWAVEFADPRSESPGESRSRVLIHQLGFQVPALQSVIRLPDASTARLDFDWQADGVAGEFDGRVKFEESATLSGSPQAGVYWRQVRREEKIRDTGRKVARWHWEDLADPRRLEVKLLREGVSRR